MQESCFFWRSRTKYFWLDFQRSQRDWFKRGNRNARYLAYAPFHLSVLRNLGCTGLHLKWQSRNCWDWKAPPDQTSPAQAESPSCPGSCPDDFWKSPNGYSAASLGNLCQFSGTLTVRKGVSWCSEGSSCSSVCAQCLLFCYWAPLKRAGLCPLRTLPSGFMHISNIPLSHLILQLTLEIFLMWAVALL